MQLTGERLKQQRIAAGLTQKKVAEALDITLDSYKNYESGRRGVPDSALYSAGKLYNVSLDYLVGLTDIPYAPGVVEDDVLVSYYRLSKEDMMLVAERIRTLQEKQAAALAAHLKKEEQ